MSSFPTAKPGPGGFNSPVGEVLPRRCPVGALGESTEPQRRRVAKMEVRRRGPHSLGFLLTGPASSPWGPWLFLGAPNHRAGLKVRSGAPFHQQRGRHAVPLAQLSDCHAIPSNWRQQSITAKWREGPGRWVESPISHLGSLRWSTTQRQGMSQAGAPPGQPVEPHGQEEEPKPKSCPKGSPQNPNWADLWGSDGTNPYVSHGQNLGFSRPLLKTLRSYRTVSFQVKDLVLKAPRKLAPTHWSSSPALPGNYLLRISA